MDSLIDELVAKHVVDVEEVVRVLAGVLHHLSWKWSLPPVSKLVFLVSKDTTIGLKKESKSERLEAQNSGSLSCVKHVYDVNAEVSLQPLHVHISTMKHFGFRGIVEDGSELVSNKTSELDCVDNEVSGSSGDLHEASEPLVASHLVAFKIYSNLIDRLEMVSHFI